MIGGYICKELDTGIDRRIQACLDHFCETIPVWNNGYLFYDNPFKDDAVLPFKSDNLVLLSQDFLVACDLGSGYRRFDIQADFLPQFRKNGTAALNSIVSDFRMIIAEKVDSRTTLLLVSNRAGSGRMHYHFTKNGILFSSDLRFLLRIIDLEVNPLAVYSILKYGAAPEPLTISKNISTVPPAHYLKFDLKENKHTLSTYFKFKFTYADNKTAPAVTADILKPAKTTFKQIARYLGKYQPAILLSGGIDSSLFACYLNEAPGGKINGFYCGFDGADPEFQFAEAVAGKTNIPLHIARMTTNNALETLEDVVNLTDHPFADFSSLPITFILKYINRNHPEQTLLIECNGGDDCFGFPALELNYKYMIKHRFPLFLKRLIVELFKNTPYWKWESHEGILARIAALADVHERNFLDYFLVQTPTNYLQFDTSPEWDSVLSGAMEDVFSSCGEKYNSLSFAANTTIRQLLHINSRLWSAKALSVGENLGLRVIYPYIWHEILVEQGKLPFRAKTYDGIVKWPLKKLLEEHMQQEFIYREKSGFVPPFAKWLSNKNFNHSVRDILLARNGHVTEIVSTVILEELLSDALNGKKLRFPVLNFLWAAIFTEMWVQKYKNFE